MGNPVVGGPVVFHQAWDFVAEVGGVVIGGFSSAEGLEREHKVVVQLEGGQREPVDVSNTTTMAKPITLKRGASNNAELYQWSENVRLGIRDIRDVSIVRQRNGTPVARFNCVGCALTTYKPGDLDRSKEEENAVEEIAFQPKSWTRIDL